MSSTQEIQERLAEPFAPDEVEWKPQTAKGNRALAVAYIDARCVMERLDAVVGVAGWQDSYMVLDDGNVVCKLSVNVAGEWVTKEDVGGPSDQKDVGDKRKASFSDALKRAAVKFGIGRYLYSLPHQWCDYDEQRRQFVKTPSLPAWALPKKPGQSQQQPKPQPAPAAAQTTVPAKAAPANGVELLARLTEYEGKLVAQHLCEPGELVKHVLDAGTRAGWSAIMGHWGKDAVAVAPPAVKAFEEQRRADFERQSKVLAELRQRYDDVTPAGIEALEKEIAVADIRLADRDELIRGLREKQQAAGGKTRKARAG